MIIQIIKKNSDEECGSDFFLTVDGEKFYAEIGGQRGVFVLRGWPVAKPDGMYVKPLNEFEHIYGTTREEILSACRGYRTQPSTTGDKTPYHKDPEMLGF